MPSLNNIDPQGELVRRILAIEDKLRGVAITRREVPHNAKAGTAGVALAAGTNTAIPFDDVIYENPAGCIDGSGRFVTPSDGIYLVVANVSLAMASAPSQITMGWGEANGLNQPGDGLIEDVPTSVHTIIFTTVTPMRSSQNPFRVWVNPGPQTGSVFAWSGLAVQRLSDLPRDTGS